MKVGMHTSGVHLMGEKKLSPRDASRAIKKFPQSDESLLLDR